jgi:hypothetical protein
VLEETLDFSALKLDLPANRFTLKELTEITGRDPKTIRALTGNPVGGIVSVQPNQRTLLLAAESISPVHLSPLQIDALRRRLAVWPSERGWDPIGGAKTLAVRTLAQHRQSVARVPANDLLADAPDGCHRIFRFEQPN